MRKLLPILLTALFCASCNDDRFIETFTQESDEVRLVQKRMVVFQYDPLTCQMGFSRSRKEFRVYTDDMSDFFTLTLSEIPVSVGEEVTGSLIWTTGPEIYAKENVTFLTEKLEGDKIWLWTTNGKIGVVVQCLD